MTWAVAALAATFGLASGACSSASPAAASHSGGGAPAGTTEIANDGPATVTADQTWQDGTLIAGPVTIEAGATVTLAPGATVQVAPDVVITVKGTLRASAQDHHVKMTGPTWGGFVVAGGTLDLTGVDIENVNVAIETQQGQATMTGGSIAWASTPFRVGPATTLTFANTVVAHAQGPARVRGIFKATQMDFESVGDEGIVVDAKDGSVEIDNSKLHGEGPPTDMIVVSAGSLLLSHIEITNVHCGLHFWNVNHVDVSFADIHDCGEGAMLYGSTATDSLSIRDSNFRNNTDFGIHEADGAQNSAMTLEGCYIGGNGQDQQLQANTHIAVTNPASGPVAGAGPTK